MPTNGFQEKRSERLGTGRKRKSGRDGRFHMLRLFVNTAANLETFVFRAIDEQ